MKLYSSASEVNMLKRGEKLRLLTHQIARSEDLYFYHAIAIMINNKIK